MRKIFSLLLLALCLMLALLPAAALGEDGPINVSDEVVFNKQTSYPYTGEPVDFAPTHDLISGWEYL